MIRVVAFFILMAVVALAIDLLSTLQGDVVIFFSTYKITVSPIVALGVALIAVVLVIIVWSLLKALFGAPKKIVRASRARRQTKGFTALSSGVVAVGAGNSREAKRHARAAERLMPNEPLTQLLKAQAAQLSGDRAMAEASFTEMLKTPQTQTLGLRGLHLEARRRGDHETAYQFARKARELEPLPWAGQAALQHLAANGDWDSALAALESNVQAGITDKSSADRLRAVFKTASAQEKIDRDPNAALALARNANRLAPDLVPAAVLAGRMLSRQGDISRAMRTLEAAWRRCPHPDIAEAYLGVRPGDSARDRLARAQELSQWALEDQEGKIVVGRAALEARDVELARKSMMPIFQQGASLGRPTVRACLLMADIEEYSGAPGKVREWLTRASSASKDPAWIADGVVAREWAPVSPTTGRIDAYVWQRPPEQLTALPPPTAMVTDNNSASAGDHVAEDRPTVSPSAAQAALPPPEPAHNEPAHNKPVHDKPAHEPAHDAPALEHRSQPAAITSG